MEDIGDSFEDGRQSLVLDDDHYGGIASWSPWRHYCFANNSPQYGITPIYQQRQVTSSGQLKDSPGCAYLHKPVIAMVMGSLMSAAGVLLLLLHVSQVGSACLSVGLMFVMVGLVWVPVLKEKHRRKRCALGE